MNEILFTHIFGLYHGAYTLYSDGFFAHAQIELPLEWIY